MAKSNVKIVISAVDKATGALNKIGGAIGGLGRTIGKMAIGAGAAIASIGVTIGKLAVDAGKFQSVSDSFSSMTKGMGISGDKLVKDIKKATSGTIKEIDIMTSFMQAKTLIGAEALGEGGENFVKFAEIAKKAARVTGHDVDYMFDSIVKGIGRASVPILDNTGLVLKQTQVYDEFAKSIGKTSDQLTIAEKKVALTNAFLKKANEEYGDVAVSAGGIGSAWSRLKVSLSELITQLGMRFIPLAQPVIEFLTDMVSKFGALADLLMTGAFTEDIGEKLGGLKEDSPVVKGVLALRDGLIRIKDIAVKAFVRIKAAIDKVLPKLQAMAQKWVPKIREAFQKVKKIVMDVVTTAIDRFKERWDEIVKTYNEHLKPAFKELKQVLGEAFKTGADDGENFGKTVGDSLINIIKGAIRVVSAIVTIIKWIVKVGEIFVSIAQKIVEWTNSTVQFFKDLKTNIKEVNESIKQGFLDLIAKVFEINEQMKAKVREIWESIKSFISTKISEAIEFLRVRIEYAKALFEGFKASVRQKIQLVRDIIQNAFHAAVNLVMNRVNRIKNFFTNTLPNRVQAGINKVKNIISGISGSIRGAMNTLIANFESGINKLIDGANKLANKVPGVGTIGHISIPRLQRGTENFRGGLAMVGEAGPEMVSLPRGSKVFNADKTRDMLSNNITINIGTVDSKQRVDQLVAKLELALGNRFNLEGRNV